MPPTWGDVLKVFGISFKIGCFVISAIAGFTLVMMLAVIGSIAISDVYAKFTDEE